MGLFGAMYLLRILHGCKKGNIAWLQEREDIAWLQETRILHGCKEGDIAWLQEEEHCMVARRGNIA